MQKYSMWCAVTHRHSPMPDENGSMYLASDMDAKIKEYEEDNTCLSEAASKLCARIDSLETVIETQAQRIEELRTALSHSPCPRPIEDDETAEDCVRNGHCGCENKPLLTSE